MSLKLKAILQGEELETKDGFLKHLHYEGSREHTLYYTNHGVHCSEPNCIINKDNKSSVREWIFIK